MLTYLQVHLIFTIPPLLALLAVLQPIRTRLDTQKLCFLVAIAVTATTPWDAYVISQGMWSYPEGAVLGTSWGIPWEEIAFFVIQTAFTSTLHSLLTRPLLPALAVPLRPASNAFYLALFSAPLAILLIPSETADSTASSTFYLRALLLWASPFLLLLLFTTSHFSFSPSRRTTTLLSILIPTAYLGWVDGFAIQQGVWLISPSATLGVFVWRDMPLEELLFFFITNCLIVFGHEAIDLAAGLYALYPDLVCGRRTLGGLPFSVDSLLALYAPVTSWPEGRKVDLEDAVKVLERKSRSFWVASAAFPAAVRGDLVALYSFCRVTDDLIDAPPDDCELSPQDMVSMITSYLDLIYGPLTSASPQPYDPPFPTSLPAPQPSRPSGLYPPPAPPIISPSALDAYLQKLVPVSAHQSFRLLSHLTHRLPRYPIDDLLRGYSTDLRFASSSPSSSPPLPPIQTTHDLLDYCLCVAGSVAELVVYASWAAYPDQVPRTPTEREKVLVRSREMGVALQLVNIARDIREDAKEERCYVPQAWFDGSELPASSSSHSPLVEPSPEHYSTLLSPPALDVSTFPWSTYSLPLLAMGRQFSASSRSAIAGLPQETRAGARAACGGYLLIGDRIADEWKGDVRERRRASGVDRLKRVAWEIWFGA